MKKIAKIVFLTLSLLLLSACSKEGGSSDPFKASLIDKEVMGVTYVIEERTGTTDETGSFVYAYDDRYVEFRVGGAYLGKYELIKLHSDKNIFITDLAGVDRADSTKPKVVKILRFLQSLDSDNNTANGITISADVSELLKDEKLDFTDEKLNIKEIEKALEKINITLISEQEAIAHFEKSLIESGENIQESQAPVFKSKDIFTIKNHASFVANLDVLSSTKVQLYLGGPDKNSFNLDGTKLSLNFSSDFSHKSIYRINVTARSSHKDATTQKITVRIEDDGTYDSDMDFIPDAIENYLGMNPNNPDQNNNGILDGLESGTDISDQFFDKQWYIRSLGTLVNGSKVKTIAGNDLDIFDVYHRYMGYNGGNPIIIQVVDNGVDLDHPDLNIDNDRSEDGYPNTQNDNHGTQVAGIIGAKGFNKIGVRGIAPFAKIAGRNYIGKQFAVSLEDIWLDDKGSSNEIIVSNNSWGASYNQEAESEKIMQIGVNTLRDGKGRIYVVASGNDRGKKVNTNFASMTSSRFPVIVAALNHKNKYSSYSTFGSSLLVSGYGGEYYQSGPTIATTNIRGTSKDKGDLNKKTTWVEDEKKDYTFAMNGTSAASPVVSASIGLVLEACPQMTWRDVKYSVAKNAKMVDANNPSWVKNGAGLYHSIDYGYGLINPTDMIRECTSSGYTLLSAELNQTKEITYDKPVFVADNNTSVELTINMTEADIAVEWVEMTIENNSTYASDYEITLTSPSGTKTQLSNALNYFSREVSNWMAHGIRFSSAAFLDEKSSGDWKVHITDKNEGDEGSVKSIELKIYGH